MTPATALVAPPVPDRRRADHGRRHAGAARQARRERVRRARAVRARRAQLGRGARRNSCAPCYETLDERGAGFSGRHHREPGPAAARHRAHHQLAARPHLPRRARARSALLPAARAALRRLPLADPRPLPVRLLHASGRRRLRHPRAQCRARDPEGLEGACRDENRQHRRARDDWIDELCAAQRPGYSLDQAFYCNPDIFERDVERVLGNHWIMAGHASQIPAAGDFFLFDVGGESIILVRGAGGAIHAHYNVCRHRGSRVLLECSGHAASLTCRYHGWSYALGRQR